MSNCPYRSKQILCGCCNRSKCAYPNIPASSFAPHLEGECWEYKCNLTYFTTCKTQNCSSILSKEIEKTKEEKQNSIEYHKRKLVQFDEHLAELKKAQLMNKIISK